MSYKIVQTSELLIIPKLNKEEVSLIGVLKADKKVMKGVYLQEGLYWELLLGRSRGEIHISSKGTFPLLSTSAGVEWLLLDMTKI